MEIVVSSSRLKVDPICRDIISFLDKESAGLELENAVVYYDFPLFRDYEDELYQPSLLILDHIKGVIVISVSETAFSIARDDHLLVDFFSLLYSKFLSSRRLRKNKQLLKFDINTILYLVDNQNIPPHEFENTYVKSLEGLQAEILNINSDKLSDDDVLEIRSIVEGFKALTKLKSRDGFGEELKPKALVLSKLEDEIYNFDAHQRSAALTVALGPQRIRGLAGSGKTIILAWKAAQILLTDPSKKILFTFYTKSLYDLIRQQITRFYRHYKDSDPDWNNLHVLHAWGGNREAGVYFNACIDHGVFPKKFDSIRHVPEPFAYICEELISKTNIEAKYDYVLIDEAQDLPESFFQLLYFLTNGERDRKCLIWAYDEFQSIFQTKMRTPAELFGLDSDGTARIDLDRSAKSIGLSEYISNDLILYKCYRNPLDVLVLSHALGLGIYGSNIVQMLQDKDHWEDIGYEVLKGDFVEGSRTIIKRPETNSPLSILKYESKEEIIKTFEAPSLRDELEWVVSEAIKFMQGGIRPEEILIICLDDRNAKTYFGALSKLFNERDVLTHDILTNPFSSSHFKLEDKITLSTVHKAKGNEAALVFVTGIDALQYSMDGRKARNRIFTAFTRTKCWLRISGISMPTSIFIFQEINKASSNSPILDFNWPNIEQVEMLQRDLSTRHTKAKKLTDDYMRRMAELGFSEEEAVAARNTVEKKI